MNAIITLMIIRNMFMRVKRNLISRVNRNLTLSVTVKLALTRILQGENNVKFVRLVEFEIEMKLLNKTKYIPHREKD